MSRFDDIFTLLQAVCNVKKVKNILIFVLVTCMSRLLSEDIKWSATSSIWSQYLARPGLILYDGPTMQNDISGSWKGIYAGLWSSTGLGESDNLRQEYQAYFGHRTTLSIITIDWNLRYDAFNDMSSTDDDLWMFDARLDFSKVPHVQPYIATRHFHGVDGIESINGWFYWIGARHSHSLGFVGAKVVLDVSVAYCDGALNRDSGWVYQRSVLQFAFPLTKQLVLTPQVTVQAPLSVPGFTSELIVVGGASLAYKF